MSLFTQFGLSPSAKLSAPYPTWSQQNVRTVELAIVTAWGHLANDVTTKQILDSGTEVEISTRLLDVLVSLLNDELVDGFTGYVFEPPIRGQELEDVTGAELEKRPDISIRLRASTPYTQHNSLFFECKRISPKRTVADYVNEGLLKFCDQRYAWGMSHAGMLAYVQNVAPRPEANVELEKYWLNNPASFTVPICDLVVESNGSASVTITTHQRSIPLPNGDVASHITLRHLWLSS
jgi:hypothetical protein